MKKIATIVGISMISLAVGLSPVFSQQTKPPEQPAATAVQPKADEKAPVAGAAAKDEKTIPVKPGTDVKTDKAAPVVPGKTSVDVKSDKAVAPHSGHAVETKAAVKSGQEVKPEKAATGKVEASKPASGQDAAKTATGSAPNAKAADSQVGKGNPVKPATGAEPAKADAPKPEIK